MAINEVVALVSAVVLAATLVSARRRMQRRDEARRLRVDLPDGTTLELSTRRTENDSQRLLSAARAIDDRHVPSDRKNSGMHVMGAGTARSG
jgi:hypothetical protein